MLVKTAELWAFGAVRVPLIFWLRPRLVELSDERASLKIPLRRRTRNHAGSMYFGALVTGADIVPGVMAVTIARKLARRITFAFKECNARFLSSPRSAVTFTCEEGERIRRAIEASAAGRTREDAKVQVRATCGASAAELVAEFDMTLSVKAR